MRSAPFWLYARLALALILAGALTPGHAQDLLQVWQTALQRDPLYAAARSGSNADQELVPQARAQLLPYITAGVGAEANDLRRIRGLDQSYRQNRGVWALTLTQPIIDVGKWGQLRQSEYIARSAEISLQQAYQDLILRVSQAYFDVLAAQDTLRALQAQKSAIATQLQAARLGFELGATTVTDTYEAQSRLDLVNANELEAHNVLQISQDQLAKIINERPGTLAELAAGTSLPAPKPNRLPDWVDQSRQASLTVARADLATKIVEKQIEIAKSGHYPTLSLQAQTGSASDRGLYLNGDGPRALESTIGLQLSIPIFAGGGISSEVREQTSRLQQTRYDLEAAKRQAVQSTQQYFSGVTTGLARIRILQSAEKSSQASVRANQTGYQLGVRINIDVLNAQQQLYETQRALSLARYDTLMNSLRLKANSGILSEADLVAINQLLTLDRAATRVYSQPTTAPQGSAVKLKAGTRRGGAISAPNLVD